jgi:hypothetical protein
VMVLTERVVHGTKRRHLSRADQGHSRT